MADQVSPYDARSVANYILSLASERKIHITQIMLHKLLYFSQGWYLVTHVKPLIKQPFEAWRHGPVIKIIRDEFKDFGANEITRYATSIDIFTGKKSIVDHRLSLDDARFVEYILLAYHGFDAWKLSEMTHEPDSPWHRLWSTKEPTGRLALRLRNEDIAAHFARLSSQIRQS